MPCCCIGNYKGTTNQSTRKLLEFTRHLTPSPLGEGQGVRPIVSEWLRLYLLLRYIFEGERR